MCNRPNRNYGESRQVVRTNVNCCWKLAGMTLSPNDMPSLEVRVVNIMDIEQLKSEWKKKSNILPVQMGFCIVSNV